MEVAVPVAEAVVSVSTLGVEASDAEEALPADAEVAALVAEAAAPVDAVAVAELVAEVSASDAAAAVGAAAAVLVAEAAVPVDAAAAAELDAEVVASGGQAVAVAVAVEVAVVAEPAAEEMAVVHPEEGACALSALGLLAIRGLALQSRRHSKSS